MAYIEFDVADYLDELSNRELTKELKRRNIYPVGRKIGLTLRRNWPIFSS